MKRIKQTSGPLLLVFLMCSLMACAVQLRAQRAEGVTVSFSLNSSQFTLHEPVILEFAVNNGSGQALQVDLGNDRKRSFLITVTRPDGERVSLPGPYKEGMGRMPQVSIGPSTEYKLNLLLNEWYDFGMAGRYEVEVRLTQLIKTAEGIVVTEVAPFHTSLEILPSNPARLKQVCALLVRQIYAAPSYEAAAEAAVQLSYVRDPIAVSYLEKVQYSGRLVEGIAIDGLRRIGNQQAIQVLISALGSGPSNENPHLRELAGAALGVIAFESQDPVLKATIQRAIERTNQKKP